MIRWIVIGVLACTATAVAQPSSKQRADATAAYQDGQRRYLDEDYVGAAQQFEAAYKLDPDPAYEFNIAQAYRLAKNCEKSVYWYRKFLVDAPKAPNAEAVKKYIADEEAACIKPVQPPPAQPLEPEPPSEPVPDSGAERSHVKRNLGFGALGAAAVGITVGIVFTLKVRSTAEEREGLCPDEPMCTWTETKAKREDRLKTLGARRSAIAISGYAVGAAALGAGIWLLLSDRDASRESSVAIVPTEGGAFVSWSFRK
ncbi:MAG TPA: hypothetical protein VIV11_37220 [Kofleriaceae bacterium]